MGSERTGLENFILPQLPFAGMSTVTAEQFPAMEDPLSVVWRDHIRALTGPELASVNAVEAHIAKFHQRLVADGLAGSKLPAEILDRIASFLANTTPEADDAVSTGLRVIRTASQLFYADLLKQTVILPLLKEYALGPGASTQLRFPTALLAQWAELHGSQYTRVNDFHGFEKGVSDSLTADGFTCRRHPSGSWGLEISLN